ncbi:MAG: IS200/IS605 family transposase [Candidatus Nitricoxidivorans perseverans]|uniref:IS200/IS605 family transposase n=1 Tax=Candidatus Nitricoxidivorans perseverans TaxID=2975601 RepID=A0AA49FNQ1_9PROT|nr:MAG: IS200/IS605 family transposase [Candidatus Nitricoxidivorans perseverans]
MSNDNDIRYGRHCDFLMHVHLVFVTKYRRKVFTVAILDELHGIFASVCTDFESELMEFDGEDDQVHLRVNYRQRGSGARLITASRPPAVGFAVPCALGHPVKAVRSDWP